MEKWPCVGTLVLVGSGAWAPEHHTSIFAHLLSNSRGAGDSVSAGFVCAWQETHTGLKGFETGLYLPHLSQSLLAVC